MAPKRPMGLAGAARARTAAASSASSAAAASAAAEDSSPVSNAKRVRLTNDSTTSAAADGAKESASAEGEEEEVDDVSDVVKLFQDACEMRESDPEQYEQLLHGIVNECDRMVRAHVQQLMAELGSEDAVTEGEQKARAEKNNLRSERISARLNGKSVDVKDVDGKFWLPAEFYLTYAGALYCLVETMPSDDDDDDDNEEDDEEESEKPSNEDKIGFYELALEQLKKARSSDVTDSTLSESSQQAAAKRGAEYSVHHNAIETLESNINLCLMSLVPGSTDDEDEDEDESDNEEDEESEEEASKQVEYLATAASAIDDVVQHFNDTNQTNTADLAKLLNSALVLIQSAPASISADHIVPVMHLVPSTIESDDTELNAALGQWYWHVASVVIDAADDDDSDDDDDSEDEDAVKSKASGSAAGSKADAEESEVNSALVASICAELDTAAMYLTKVIDSKSADDHLLANTLVTLGEVELNRGNYEESEDAQNSKYEIARSHFRKAQTLLKSYCEDLPEPLLDFLNNDN
ncbi:hypothetical protein GQ42DRAFT_160157 [Ramicandelaber brevisporus]|nr:hypothetical protein GQ42DRAFT_160157 [Ramicandelaber brevisporus]